MPELQWQAIIICVFDRAMLDRYVNDEFKAADTNFSSSLCLALTITITLTLTLTLSLTQS